MFDANGDGKRDWHDDYVISEIIGSENKKSVRPKTVQSGGGCVTLFVCALALWGIINLLAKVFY